MSNDKQNLTDEEELVIPVVEETEEVAKEEVKEPSELEKALASAEDYKRKWYSVSAEYDNYRKRNQVAVAQAYADGKADA
ncbi:MAG: nucleotide exchange factor GrpE, partial [Clostridia bacterium]|nr:nucleotide exchange factor GrpE [Clostridia bacterium]